MEKGEFDNLPGKGKPLDLSEYFKAPPELRVAHNLLKNAGVIPQEITLKKELESLKETRQSAHNSEEISRLTREINLKTAQLNLLMERKQK